MTTNYGENLAGRAVVITGASTGIGKGCALALDKLGARVFAGVRKEADGAALQAEASERLTPVMLDVTDGDQIQAAVRLVQEGMGDAGLAGLINNAGIGVGGPLEFIDLDDLRWQMEVNVIGPMAMIRAFMPLIRQGKGRIVNISSIAGRSATPFMGPYSASKHALEALSDALRVELRPWNIHVSLIEPGAVQTPIWDKAMATLEETVRKLPPEGLEMYGPMIEFMRKVIAAGDGIPVSQVVDKTLHALTADKPKARYLVGREARIRAMVERLPDGLRDRVIASQLPKYG